MSIMALFVQLAVALIEEIFGVHIAPNILSIKYTGLHQKTLNGFITARST